MVREGRGRRRGRMGTSEGKCAVDALVPPLAMGGAPRGDDQPGESEAALPDAAEVEGLWVFEKGHIGGSMNEERTKKEREMEAI